MNVEELPSDPYASLGVASNASTADIKAAYRRLALKYHPDKCSDDAQKEINTNEFHKIQKAYDIIGNEDERSRYDARIRLNDLLRERDALRSAARPSASRGATAYPAQQSFPIREVRVEERKPRSYDDSDADYFRTSYTSRTEYETVRRPTATRIRTERPRDREQRRRSDRARERDTDRRDSRTAKYEFDDEPSFAPDHDERVRPRAADDIKLKYDSLQEGVYRYRSKVSPERTRPSPPMRTSTRGSSKYHEPRRSQASRDREAEILGRERDRLWGSIHRENALFGEVRHQDRDPYQRMRNRSREDEEYESHSAPLSPGHSSRYTRSQTDPLSSSRSGPPPMNRSSTMPQIRRRDAYVSQPSKLRDGATMGDSESSSSSTSDRYQHKSTPAQPVRAERVIRVRPDSVEEPPRMSYRIVEPTSSRGKKYSSGTRSAYPAGTRSSPPMRATRSPEPMSPLERGRDRDYVQDDEAYYERKPLYEERGASYPVPRGEYRSRGVAYSKRYGPDDIRYSSFQRRGSDYVDRPIPSRLSRSSTMPLPA
jgi:curved DNA-binding protein CbpA